MEASDLPFATVVDIAVQQKCGADTMANCLCIRVGELVKPVAYLPEFHVPDRHGICGETLCKCLELGRSVDLPRKGGMLFKPLDCWFSRTAGVGVMEPVQELPVIGEAG